jgi:hypothetical protein
VTDVSERYASIFVTAEWKNLETGKNPSITFTSEPPSALAKKSLLQPYPIDVFYGANANEKQLRELSAAVIQQIVEKTSGKVEVNSIIDDNGLGIKVEYGITANSEDAKGESPASQTASPIVKEDVIDEAAADLKLSELPVPVSIVPSSSLNESSLETAVRGGNFLSTKAGGSTSCTSGFTAKRDGKNGVITADHCPNTLYYIGKKDVISFVAAAKKDVYSWGTVSYDMQFHKTLSGHTTEAKFQADTKGVADVTAISDPVKGASLCHYGTISGRKCSTVYSTGACEYFSDAKSTYCKLVVMNTYVSAGGDSGGPWFSTTTAKGTHTGVITVNGTKRSVFTPISVAKSHMATTILKK